MNRFLETEHRQTISLSLFTSSVLHDDAELPFFRLVVLIILGDIAVLQHLQSTRFFLCVFLLILTHI